LQTLLARSPTDGEAQLLLGTLLRRVGRLDEARAALEQLSRADAGLVWQAAIVREFARIEADRRSGPDAGEPAILSLTQPTDGSSERTAAA
ncbi:MAG: tetratricopeptide repeat protein, partial [Thermoguttaceae bacterium]